MTGPKDDDDRTAEQQLEDFIDKRVRMVIQDTEIRLGQKLEQTAREIGTSLKPLVDAAITASLPAIVKQVGEQFESKMKDQPGKENPATGAGDEGGAATKATGGVMSFLDRATPKDIIEIVNSFRQPSTDQQLAGVFSNFIRGMSFGQKMKQGILTPQDMEDALGIGNITQTQEPKPPTPTP